MYQLNWWQNLMVWIGHIDLDDATVKFKVNEALKWNWDTAMQLGIAKGEKSKVDCLACSLYQKSQREWQTEKQMAYFQSHPGKYSAYHKDMERKKFETRKLSNPDTAEIPHIHLYVPGDGDLMP